MRENKKAWSERIQDQVPVLVEKRIVSCDVVRYELATSFSNTSSNKTRLAKYYQDLLKKEALMGMTFGKIRDTQDN